MATAFAQPPAVNTDMNYSHQQQPSPPQMYTTTPMAQTPPSTNVSPTTHYSHLHVKQLRQPRQPLYVPAALRPTDLPTRPKDVPGQPRAPDTPPDSKHGSFDSAKSSGSGSSLIGSFAVAHSNNDDLERLRSGLSSAASEALQQEQGTVNGFPTTAHWKPNESRPDCAVCHTSFTWFFRRHHCRKCGEVVCGSHLTNVVPLDQNARYHSEGMQSKACDPCAEEWKLVKKLRHSRANSLAGSMTSSQGTAKPAMPIPRPAHLEPEMRVGSLARSEGGMVWSTF